MKRTLARAKLWLINNEEEPIMGEGKAALLEAINQEGSLNRACKKMQISYKHAWLLLKEIEESAKEPIIITQD
jgi:molybdate transport system regulatory protein